RRDGAATERGGDRLPVPLTQVERRLRELIGDQGAHVATLLVHLDALGGPSRRELRPVRRRVAEVLERRVEVQRRRIRRKGGRQGGAEGCRRDPEVSGDEDVTGVLCHD